MDAKQLKEVIENHGKWLRNEDGGTYANLTRANLTDADLTGADLTGAIKIPMHCKWSHGITDNMIHIGCEKRTIEDWDKFFAQNEVIESERGTPEFKQIEAVYNAYKAYILTLNNK